MRRIALINQKGGVGKTTTAVNLGAALARAGRRVVLVDLDPQANLSMHLEFAVEGEQPSTYSVLSGETTFAQTLRATSTPGMRLVPSSIDLSGAELELANTFGREMLMREAIERWESEERDARGETPCDYLLLDCPPSLGLLSVNGLVAAREVLIAVQTEFFALQGMSKLVEVVQLLRRRLNPTLEVAGILPCLYDSRLKLAREVLAEIRTYFPGKVFQRAIAKNVKLAEAPSYGRTIFEYAPESQGAQDYAAVAAEVMAQEERRSPELVARAADVGGPFATPSQAAPPPAPSQQGHPDQPGRGARTGRTTGKSTEKRSEEPAATPDGSAAAPAPRRARPRRRATGQSGPAAEGGNGVVEEVEQVAEVAEPNAKTLKTVELRPAPRKDASPGADASGASPVAGDVGLD